MSAQPGFEAHVATLGSGPRKVLALHCTMAYSGAWKEFAAAVEGRAELIAPDMPSHGRSADWDEKSSFADTVYAASLACLTEPMDVIGHSFGGAAALRLAVDHPDLVRSLTMIEPPFFCIAQEDAPEINRAHRKQMEPFFAAMRTGDREFAARTFNAMWSDRARWQRIPEPIRAAMCRGVHVVPDTGAFLFDDTANLVPRLATTRIPTLLLHGATTEEISKVTNAGLARRLPRAETVEVAGAGHMAPITHADEVAAIWSGFLERAEAA